MTKKVAFLCLAHNQFDYLKKASHYYCSNNDDLFIHIDARVTIPCVNGFHHKTVLLSEDERVATAWGSFAIIEATQALIKKALLKDDYDHFVLISGVDLPLLPKSELKSYLTEDKNYFSIWDQVDINQPHQLSHEFFKRHHYNFKLTNPGQAYATGSRWHIYPMLIANKLIAMLPLSKQRFKQKYYSKGSQWWCVSKDMAQYFVDELSKPDVVSEFKYMHAPDEKVFQTLAVNSPFSYNIEIDHGQHSLKQGIHFIDWGYQQEKVALQPFNLSDVNQALKMHCAFARKLVLDNDNSNIYQYLDCLINNNKRDSE